WISCFNFLFVTIFVIIDTRKAAMIKAIKNQNNGNIGPISLFNDYNNYVIKWINKQLFKLNKLCLMSIGNVRTYQHLVYNLWMSSVYVYGYDLLSENLIQKGIAFCLWITRITLWTALVIRFIVVNNSWVKKHKKYGI